MESEVTISTFGSLLGLILGVLGTMIIITIVKAITGAPFQAAYTFNTLMIIAVVVPLVGILFGSWVWMTRLLTPYSS